MSAAFAPWVAANEREQAVYEHYMGGSERGDLFRYVKLGKIGQGKPHRSAGNAFAAWMAGHDLAAKTRGAL
jgi:hypothetical protein